MRRFGSTREVVEALRTADEIEREYIFDTLESEEIAEGVTALDALRYDWLAWGRPEQLAPDPGVQWMFLFLRAGRGGGKTRAGAEMMIEASMDVATVRMALVAPTHADIRATMVEGTSGILACSPPWWRPEWHPGIGNGQLVWPNGVEALCFSAEKPGRIRGPEIAFLWGDEIAEWGTNGQIVHDLLTPGLRLTQNPRAVYTSTPKPTAFVEWLHNRAEKIDDQINKGTRDPRKRTYIERVWSTWANADNLPAATIEELTERFAGTTQGRQELEAELLMDDPDAMWSQGLIDRAKVLPEDVPELEMIVIAVDNATTKSPDGVIDRSTPAGRNKDVGSNDTGIVGVGLGVDGHFYVLDDWTCNETPHKWGTVVLEAFANAWKTRRANLVVVEKQAGGDLIKANLHVCMRDQGITNPAVVPLRFVNARDGKVTRAEPVVALYEQRRVHHVHRPMGAPGSVPPLLDLEYQMTRFKHGRTGYKDDRVDALVWGITALIEIPAPGQARTAAAARHRRMVS